MRHVLAAVFCLLVFLLLTGVAFGEQISLVRIQIQSKADLQTVRSLGLEQVFQGEDFVNVVVQPDQLGILDENKLTYTITHTDLISHYQGRLGAKRGLPGTMGGYRTLAEIEGGMDSVAASNPVIVKPKWSIGQSLNGEDIWVMKVSDNPLIDEDEPEIYYFAAIHAREVITPEVLMYFLRHLTTMYGIDPEVTYLVDNRELFFTLCVNPDGYYYNEFQYPDGGGMWRKNRRNNGDGTWGVDLNRNYGYQWGYDNYGSSPDPSSTTYRGPSAFSEPETQVMRDYINSRNFVITISYHSHGNLLLWPYGYARVYTPDNLLFSIMGDSATAFNGYDPELCYDLYPTNGTTDDWGYGEQIFKEKNLAMTFEVGNESDGFWPSTSRITALVQENLEPNLFFARVADNPERLLPPVAPVVASIGEIDTSAFELTWSHDDLTNPAVDYDVWQYSGLARISDDLEAGADNWVEDGFIHSTVRAQSGSYSYFGGYDNSTDRRLSSAQALSVADGDTLQFWTYYDIETDWDYGYVEVSADGLTWNSIPGSITSTSNPNGNNLGNGITGSSGGWVLAVFSLADYADESIYLRFRYVTDTYVLEEGWYVDDIYPVETFANVAQLADAYSETSLWVDGLAEGEHYFQVFARDEQGQESAGSNLGYVLVTSGPPCEWLVGDADANDVYNISDAVYLITYIFGGGPAPVPSAAGSGDADCTGVTNISDAVYIVAFIFGDGPAPAATCSCEDYL